MNLLDNGLHLLYKMPPPPAKTYHGLINQGATCYLNSVLQVLFMTEDFREAVKRHTCDNPGTEFIDLHLKSLFDDLQRYDTYTYNITKKLCIDNVHEQRDAAEYFEKILGLTSSEASQIFHGQSTQKTTCSCSNETDSDGPFWYLTLALLNSYTRHYSVVDGIEEYFSASYFSGENQMYCDECDAKCDATMKCVIKHHPEVLMLLLKRFEFDYRYMTYVKNNCTVDVPYTLQIPENQTYELYAVVDHFGDLRSGHYTATIKAQDDERWYNFNDRWVTPLGNQSFQEDNFEKSSSAYLLFYRKKKVHPADTCTQDTREMSSPGGFPPATSGIYIDQCQDAAKRKQEVEWAEKQRDKDKDRDEGGRKERRGTASTKYPDRDAGRRDSERLDHVKQNMYEDQEGTQEVSQDDFKPVSVDKQEDGGLLTINDLYNDGIQGSGVGKKKQNTPKEDQRSKRGSRSRFYQSPEQPRVEEKDVKGDKRQKRGHDEHAHRKGASERQEQDQNRRSESVTTQRDVGAAKRAKGGNEHSQRADSSLRQAGLAGSSIVTENRGDGSVEKSQPSRARTGLSEDANEGRRSSKQSKTCFGKIIEEEIITTCSGVKKITVTKTIRIITVEGSSQGSLKSWVEYDDGNAEIESDPKTDAKVTLSEHDHDLLKSKKARKMQNVSDEQAVGGKTHGERKSREEKTLVASLFPSEAKQKGQKETQ